MLNKILIAASLVAVFSTNVYATPQTWQIEVLCEDEMEGVCLEYRRVEGYQIIGPEGRDLKGYQPFEMKTITKGEHTAVEIRFRRMADEKDLVFAGSIPNSHNYDSDARRALDTKFCLTEQVELQEGEESLLAKAQLTFCKEILIASMLYNLVAKNLGFEEFSYEYDPESKVSSRVFKYSSVLYRRCAPYKAQSLQ